MVEVAVADRKRTSFSEEATSLAVAAGPVGVNASSEQPFLLGANEEDVVALVDPRPAARPIAGASAGFCSLFGRSCEELYGAAISSLLEGVPSVAVSRSAQKNFEAFCTASLAPGVCDVAESWHIHPYTRKDGSIFSSLVTLGFCRTRLGPYVVVVHTLLCEGLVASRVPPAKLELLRERAHETIRRTRQGLSAQEVSERALKCDGVPAAPGAFFADRLDDRAVLLGGGSSVERREAGELPIGCMVFGGTAMAPTKGHGLHFAVRIDGISPAFEGLPALGFTRREPCNKPGTYPSVSKCLGQSVLVGGMGEATARDKEDHFKVGFKKIPESEIAFWSAPVKKAAVPRLKEGDVMKCCYTWDGRLQLSVNGEKVLDFDVGRPLEGEGLYWPVVDVAFSVSAVTWLGASTSISAPKCETSHFLTTTVGNLSTFAPTQSFLEEGSNGSNEDAESVLSEDFDSLDGEIGTEGRAITDDELLSEPKEEAAEPCALLPAPGMISPIGGGASSALVLACAAAAAAFGAGLVLAAGRGSRHLA